MEKESSLIDSNFTTHVFNQAALQCGLPSDLLHIALGPSGRIALVTIFLTTLAVSFHTDIRKSSPTCMLAMQSIPIALSAILTGCLLAAVSACGGHAVHAGDLVYAFTLLSALHALPQCACMYARAAVVRCLMTPPPPAPESFHTPPADLEPSPATSATSSTTENSLTVGSDAASPQSASGSVARPMEAPFATYHVPWPIRHSVDGCLLLPQPRWSNHSTPAAAAAESLVMPHTPPPMPYCPTRSLGLVQHGGEACGAVAVGDLDPGVHAVHAGPQHTEQFDALMRRWSLDDPPLRWPGPTPPSPSTSPPAAGSAAAAPSAPGWYEALAANALVLDSLEPLNPKCASAFSQLRGIGLHAYNPLMHELHRRPSSFAADALQRFGLPRAGAAGVGSGVMARRGAWGEVSEELLPIGRVHTGEAGRGGTAWLPGACPEQTIGWPYGSGHAANGHGLHACVQTVCAASVAVLWQVLAIWFWAVLGRTGGCAEMRAAGPSASSAHEVGGCEGAVAEPPANGRGCPWPASEAAAVYVFFMFLKARPPPLSFSAREQSQSIPDSLGLSAKPLFSAHLAMLC